MDTGINELTIYDRVTTFEQSEKLKQLGLQQQFNEHDYAFLKGSKSLCQIRWSNEFGHCGITIIGQEHQTAQAHVSDLVKALDGVQIDQMLPTHLEYKDTIACLDYYIKSTDKSKICFYYELDDNSKPFKSWSNSKFQSKANLFIKIIEKGIIKIQ